MAEWHLKALEEALNRAGWTVTDRLAGDDYRVSATWQIERGASDGVLLIDFEGLDDMVTLPIARAYACNLRGDQDLSLYFARQGRSWETRLAEFIHGLKGGRSGSTEAGSL